MLCRILFSLVVTDTRNVCCTCISGVQIFINLSARMMSSQNKPHISWLAYPGLLLIRLLFKFITTGFRFLRLPSPLYGIKSSLCSLLTFTHHNYAPPLSLVNLIQKVSLVLLDTLWFHYHSVPVYMKVPRYLEIFVA